MGQFLKKVFSFFTSMTAADNSSTIRQLEKIVECGICLGNFDDPRILPCSHTYCFKCLQGLVRNRSSNCPLRCNITIDQNTIATLPVDRKAKEMVEVLSKLSQSSTNQLSSVQDKPSPIPQPFSRQVVVPICENAVIWNLGWTPNEQGGGCNEIVANYGYNIARGYQLQLRLPVQLISVTVKYADRVPMTVCVIDNKQKIIKKVDGGDLCRNSTKISIREELRDGYSVFVLSQTFYVRHATSQPRIINQNCSVKNMYCTLKTKPMVGSEMNGLSCTIALEMQLEVAE